MGIECTGVSTGITSRIDPRSMSSASVRRVVCIHAMKASLAPTERAFSRGFPQAQVAHLLDDSLSVDVAESGCDRVMEDRFSALGKYALEHMSADAILFTCSAFGSAIERVQAESSIPVLKPNASLQHEIVSRGGTAGVLSMFRPTLDSIVQELNQMASAESKSLRVVPYFVEGALEELQRGEDARCGELIANATLRLLDDEPHISSIALAMFSMAFARPQVTTAVAHLAAHRPDLKIITSPDAAIADLRSVLNA
eukprot:scaffold293606_cov28-Tisochrysis_lutea.AAC.1